MNHLGRTVLHAHIQAAVNLTRLPYAHRQFHEHHKFHELGQGHHDARAADRGGGNLASGTVC